MLFDNGIRYIFSLRASEVSCITFMSTVIVSIGFSFFGRLKCLRMGFSCYHTSTLSTYYDSSKRVYIDRRSFRLDILLYSLRETYKTLSFEIFFPANHRLVSTVYNLSHISHFPSIKGVSENIIDCRERERLSS